MINKRIIIIDEDKKLLGELQETLTASGYAPVAINNPLTALDMIVRNKPDVILMELKMRNKNGFELADEINRLFEPQRIPIIAMSALFKNEVELLLNLCDIKRYLRKPFHPIDVIWAIENALEENNQWENERCIERESSEIMV